MTLRTTGHVAEVRLNKSKVKGFKADGVRRFFALLMQKSDLLSLLQRKVMW